MPESVVVLIEAADRTLDHEDEAMKDWEFIKSYIVSENTLWILNIMQGWPCIGKYSKQYLFNKITKSYDAIISFIEAHEEANKMIQSVIENKEYVDKILAESFINI